jgi:hypothetical protein
MQFDPTRVAVLKDFGIQIKESGMSKEGRSEINLPLGLG